MVFDTDILIWVQRGNKKASSYIDKAKHRFISLLSYMELLQCAKNKNQHKTIKDFLISFGFTILPLTENIGHRAAIYIEEYTIPSGIRAGDAIIAATATEHNLPLLTCNEKHFRAIKELHLKVFKP